MKKKLGLYIHIPFCRSKCLYCDFCSFPRAAAETVARYAAALREDLLRRAEQCRDYTVDTVYFGGGTPTMLPARELISILDTAAGAYHFTVDAEITAECNPATGGFDYFTDMRRSGFNRLSMGLQSTHEGELRALGRIHGFDDFEKTFSQARSAGFENISADLMSGIPEQTVQSYLASIHRLARLSPEHISAYGLSVEDETSFGKMGDRLILPDEDATREMYFLGIDALASHGYQQYEISNFAREGYESRHNLKYWSCEEYLGFGPAAYSDFGGDRFGNSRELSLYIEGKEIEAEREHPTRPQRMNEYVMLGMRLTDGVDADKFEERFGESFEKTFGSRLSAYERQGLTKRTDNGWCFTKEGFYVSNAILSEILDFSE